MDFPCHFLKGPILRLPVCLYYLGNETFPGKDLFVKGKMLLKEQILFKRWPGVIELFSYSDQLTMDFLILTRTKYKKKLVQGSDKAIMLFFLLINVEMPTIVGILTFTSRKNFKLS